MKILSLDHKSYQTINEVSNYISNNLDKILLYKEKPEHPLEPFLIYFFILKNMNSKLIITLGHLI